jgi:hypothetical protein
MFTVSENGRKQIEERRVVEWLRRFRALGRRE